MNADQAKTWLIIDVVRWGAGYFTKHGIENSRLEIEWLLSYHLNLQRVDLYVQHDRPLSPDELAGFKELVKRRVAGEPFQYILGVAPFYGKDFIVNHDVLIPRPESEVLIQVLRKGSPPTSILDIGTGSGCLAITAALIYPEASVLAVDVSENALKVARENAARLGAQKVAFQQVDILTAQPRDTFDVILCNPPYVAAQELPDLQREIREYEPPLAVTDHADGLSFHRRLAAIGQSLLNRNGRILVEIGGSIQAERTKILFTETGAEVELHQDLQGNDRICEVRWVRDTTS